jgi:hypothetical protein
MIRASHLVDGNMGSCPLKFQMVGRDGQNRAARDGANALNSLILLRAAVSAGWAVDSPTAGR